MKAPSPIMARAQGEPPQLIRKTLKRTVTAEPGEDEDRSQSPRHAFQFDELALDSEPMSPPALRESSKLHRDLLQEASGLSEEAFLLESASDDEHFASCESEHFDECAPIDAKDEKIFARLSENRCLKDSHAAEEIAMMWRKVHAADEELKDQEAFLTTAKEAMRDAHRNMMLDCVYAQEHDAQEHDGERLAVQDRVWEFRNPADARWLWESLRQYRVESQLAPGQTFPALSADWGSVARKPHGRGPSLLNVVGDPEMMGLRQRHDPRTWQMKKAHPRVAALRAKVAEYEHPVTGLKLRVTKTERNTKKEMWSAKEGAWIELKEE